MNISETLKIGEKNYLKLQINDEIIFDGYFKTYKNLGYEYEITDLNGNVIKYSRPMYTHTY